MIPPKLLLVAAVPFLAGFIIAAGEDDRAAMVERGHVVFERNCAPCHGAGPGHDGSPMLPGTAALQVKYKGEIPAVLEQRGDLDAMVIRMFVRNGSGAMPMFRKTEVSDADAEAIAAYLEVSARRGRR